MRPRGASDDRILFFTDLNGCYFNPSQTLKTFPPRLSLWKTCCERGNWTPRPRAAISPCEAHNKLGARHSQSSKGSAYILRYPFRRTNPLRTRACHLGHKLRPSPLSPHPPRRGASASHPDVAERRLLRGASHVTPRPAGLLDDHENRRCQKASMRRQARVSYHSI